MNAIAQQAKLTAAEINAAAGSLAPTAGGRANSGAGLHSESAPRDLAEVLPSFDAPASGPEGFPLRSGKFLIVEGSTGDCAFCPDKVSAVRPNHEGGANAVVIMDSGQTILTRWSVPGLLAAMAAFRDSESGATLIEYSLIAALVSVVAIGALTTMGSELKTIFGSIAASMNVAANI